MRIHTLSDFDYTLPSERIAQFPPTARGASRLLDVESDTVRDRMFRELTSVVRAGDLLVFNDTKVIRARLHATKTTGGKAEILIERVLDQHTALAQIRASKPPQSGRYLEITPDFAPQVLGREGPFFLLKFPPEKTVLEWLDAHGELPLPPYITHSPDAVDDARYQTVYAKHHGAVAAPTAGLHFTDEILAQLDAMGVERAHITLHVGAGTFKPVRTEDLAQHEMHSESYEITPHAAAQVMKAKAEGRRVIAVGTTSLRALESAAPHPNGLSSGAHSTQLFITPGYEFRIVDALITNFHLPKSTLLMLVSAFAGFETIQKAYAHAIDHQYQFFSYGDAMFLRRR